MFSFVDDSKVMARDLARFIRWLRSISSDLHGGNKNHPNEETDESAMELYAEPFEVEWKGMFFEDSIDEDDEI